MASLCGADCTSCFMKSQCAGCTETCGSPFGGRCVVAEICKKNNVCGKECGAVTEYKKLLLSEINSLGIADLPEITELYQLCGSFVNLEFTLSGGEKIKLLNDADVYSGTQVEKGDGRCYGIAADDSVILVSEYGENGADPEIVIYKRRDKR